MNDPERQELEQLKQMHALMQSELLLLGKRLAALEARRQNFAAVEPGRAPVPAPEPAAQARLLSQPVEPAADLPASKTELAVPPVIPAPDSAVDTPVTSSLRTGAAPSTPLALGPDLTPGAVKPHEAVSKVIETATIEKSTAPEPKPAISSPNATNGSFELRLGT